MNMISHGQAASNGYSKNFKRSRTSLHSGWLLLVDSRFSLLTPLFGTCGFLVLFLLLPVCVTDAPTWATEVFEDTTFWFFVKI